jgi:hypothetical protein
MPEPTVREMLLAKVDELVAKATAILEELGAVTEQLEPERARSCRNAITMASVMIDEIRLRAHARPLDEPDCEAYVAAGPLGSDGPERTPPRFTCAPGGPFASVAGSLTRRRMGRATTERRPRPPEETGENSPVNG